MDAVVLVCGALLELLAERREIRRSSGPAAVHPRQDGVSVAA